MTSEWRSDGFSDAQPASLARPLWAQCSLADDEVAHKRPGPWLVRRFRLRTNTKTTSRSAATSATFSVTTAALCVRARTAASGSSAPRRPASHTWIASCPYCSRRICAAAGTSRPAGTSSRQQRVPPLSGVLRRLHCSTVTYDLRLDVIGVLGGEVDRDPDLARIRVAMVRNESNTLLLAALEVLTSGDDLPDIRAGGERCPRIMRGPRKITST